MCQMTSEDIKHQLIIMTVVSQLHESVERKFILSRERKKKEKKTKKKKKKKKTLN